MPVSVLLVDPQPFFRESLAAALGDGAVVVGSTGDEMEAADLAGGAAPDLVLTEVELAGGSGFGLVKRVGDGARVVVLTRRDEADVLFDAVEAGAHGVVGHASGLDRLRAILAGASAQSWVCDPERLRAALQRARARATQRGGSEGRIARLTVREREVLQLLARGLTRDAIAQSLYLSEHTVRTHVGNILKKLEVHSQAEAARVALRSGLTAPDVHVVRITGPDLPRP
ncbi:MAG TPA: response regulator transcription factor [Actinomycetota bacterium]|nr:response regulator transcription factor [Actinomycetota bacterium]